MLCPGPGLTCDLPLPSQFLLSAAFPTFLQPPFCEPVVSRTQYSAQVCRKPLVFGMWIQLAASVEMESKELGLVHARSTGLPPRSASLPWLLCLVVLKPEGDLYSIPFPAALPDLLPHSEVCRGLLARFFWAPHPCRGGERRFLSNALSAPFRMNRWLSCFQRCQGSSVPSCFHFSEERLRSRKAASGQGQQCLAQGSDPWVSSLVSGCFGP